MKICILLPSLVGGGAEKLHIWLAKNWIEHGHEISFLILDDHKVAGTLKPMIPDSSQLDVIGEKRLRKTLLPITKYLRKEKVDILLAPMWPMTVIAVIARFLSRSKAKIVISDHTNLSASRQSELKVSRLILSLTIAIFYRLADSIITVSKGVRDDIAALGRISESAINVIYNPPGISNVENHRDYSRINLGWQPQFKYKILGVGSLIRQKNFSNLIIAFSLLPVTTREQSQLIILGEGIERKKLEILIQSLSLEDQIFLPGFVIDPAPWFISADLFVLSSSWEGFGIVLVEAMQSKLPIVSTNCNSGPAEILNNGEFGSLVACDNPEALSRAIDESLCCGHDLDKLLARSKDFSLEKAGQDYLDIFSRLLQ